ncbi:HIT family protein, partial [Campylobacter upsaliensis]|nr:HIT family protein [Campylobacter upsaliensis]
RELDLPSFEEFEEFLRARLKN